MKPLRVQILGLLRTAPEGLSLREASRALGHDIAHTRKAFRDLKESGQAKVVRRGRGGLLVLFPPDTKVRACLICEREFTSVRKETQTCSRECAAQLRWQNEDMRKRHRKSVRRAARRPERREKMREISKTASNRPEERARRSECNRRSWANPEVRTRRVLSIKAAWKGKKGAPRRQKARNKKLALWSDQEWKAKTVAAMRTGTRGRFKRAMMRLVAVEPPLDEQQIAHRIGVSMKQVKLLMRRAYRMGEISRKPSDGRKRKQSAEEIANRIAKIRALRAWRKR